MSDHPLKDPSASTTRFLQNMNLTEAIHLICHAGYTDPREEVHPEQPEQLLQRIIDDLCALSMHDGLTGLTNLRYFQIALKRETYRSVRDGTPCSLLIMDIDHFKSINDTHGHPAGDQALKTVAQIFKNELRPGDTLSRYGGEEFTAILPNCTLRYAVQVAERLRSVVAQSPIPISGKPPLSMTISIGVAESRSSSEPDLSGLVKAADECLYKAKSLGRNRTCYETPVTTEVSPEERTALFHQNNKKKGR